MHIEFYESDERLTRAARRRIGQIVEISTNNGPAEAVITRIWDKPAKDPYVTVRTTEDQGRTFVRCSSTVKAV